MGGVCYSSQLQQFFLQTLLQRRIQQTVFDFGYLFGPHHVYFVSFPTGCSMHYVAPPTFVPFRRKWFLIASYLKAAFLHPTIAFFFSAGSFYWPYTETVCKVHTSTSCHQNAANRVCCRTSVECEKARANNPPRQDIFLYWWKCPSQKKTTVTMKTRFGGHVRHRKKPPSPHFDWFSVNFQKHAVQKVVLSDKGSKP